MTEDVTGGMTTGSSDGNAPNPPGAGPGLAPGRRQLGRDQILREAVHLIDTEGRERLTMRRLGGELGVEAMALYRYIPGREQLLDGVVEYVMNELYQQTMTEDLPGSCRSTCSGWRTAYAASAWPTPGCSPWSPPDRRPRLGFGHHCAASAGWRGSWGR